MVLGFLLPLIAWLTFFACTRRQGFGWRISFLTASLAWGCALTLLTESLSLFSALNLLSLGIGWSLITVSAGLLALGTPSVPTSSESADLSATDTFLLLAVGTVLACTLVIALVSPPNNNDAMTYHMSRVMHWMQQGSVAHYPTNVLRQLELNPWAEFAILHFQILSGGDTFANLVQWFSMAGCLVGVSLIAELFGASLRGQILAVLVAATTPMAILQASSAQNDLVVSFWLVCFAFFGEMARRQDSARWSLPMAASLGLAILTKGTAYLFALPFALWFLALDLKRSWRHAALKCLLLATVTLALNAGHLQRNLVLFGNPLHSGSDPYSNSYLTPAVLLSNVSRNLALHLLTPSPAANAPLFSALKSFHSLLGLAVDDPATTWPGTTIEGRLLAPHEDVSGNPLHLVLFIVVGALLWRRRFPGVLRHHSLMVFAGFTLFCMLLRWQPWHSRLQLPLFILFAPVAGTVISHVNPRRLAAGVAVLLSVASLPWLLCNATKPMVSLAAYVPRYPRSIFAVPRQLQYFVNNSCDQASYLKTATFIRERGIERVGLAAGENAREYPLWVLTRNGAMGGPRIEHIDIPNISRAIRSGTFDPDLVVTLASKDKSCTASCRDWKSMP